MLYDPKWTKPDALSLQGLIAWLEKQPADKPYSFMDCNGGCLLDRYLKSAGLKISNSNYTKISDLTDNGRVAATHPHTFGAALDRTRKLAATP